MRFLYYVVGGRRCQAAFDLMAPDFALRSLLDRTALILFMPELTIAPRSQEPCQAGNGRPCCGIVAVIPGPRSSTARVRQLVGEDSRRRLNFGQADETSGWLHAMQTLPSSFRPRSESNMYPN